MWLIILLSDSKLTVILRILQYFESKKERVDVVWRLRTSNQFIENVTHGFFT